MAGLIGKVGTAPEEKPTSAGTLLKFRFAVTTGSGDKRQDYWYDVVTWDERLIESSKKTLMVGHTVVVDGPVKESEYNGKTRHEIRAYRIGLIEWLDRTPYDESRKGTPAKVEDKQEDLPF